MEQVIRAYGRFLLEGAVFVLLLVLLSVRFTDGEGHRGVFRVIGAYLDEAEEEAGGAGFSGFVRESQTGSPVITYLYTGILYTGSYEADVLVGAVDAEGRSLPVRVNSVTDPRGNAKGLEAGEPQLVFNTAGVYTLRVAAMDASNRISTCDIRIPVNRREGSE